MPYPRSIYCIVLGGVTLLAACNRATGPKGLSHTTYAAMQKAVDALDYASQVRNASDTIFDPQLQAASQAAEAVYDDMGNETADGYAASQIRSCLEALKAYRANYESRESVSHPIEEQLKGLKGAKLGDATDAVSRNDKDLGACLTEVKAFL